MCAGTLAVAAPLASILLLPLTAILVAWLAPPRIGNPTRLVGAGGPALALLVFLTYALVNASWSLDRPDAYLQVAAAAVFLLSASALLHGAARLSAAQARQAALAIAVGVVAGAAVLAVEGLGGQALARTLQALVAAIGGGEPRAPAAHDLHKNAAMLMLLFWPALLVAWRIGRERGRWALGAALVAIAAVGVLASGHRTSTMAMLASVGLFAAALWRPRLALWASVGLWCASFALVLPAATLAYQAGLHQAESITPSFRARVILWSETARRVPDAPILGVGVRTTRALDETEKHTAPQPADYVFPIYAGRHAHNFFLQTWYEMGLVGVALLAASGLVLLARLGRLREPARPFALAQFAAFLAIASAAWDMWQSWLLAAFGLASVLTALTTSQTPEASRGRSGAEARPGTA